jgi:hypothetical protein
MQKLHLRFFYAGTGCASFDPNRIFRQIGTSSGEMIINKMADVKYSGATRPASVIFYATIYMILFSLFL